MTRFIGVWNGNGGPFNDRERAAAARLTEYAEVFSQIE